MKVFLRSQKEVSRERITKSGLKYAMPTLSEND